MATISKTPQLLTMPDEVILNILSHCSTFTIECVALTFSKRLTKIALPFLDRLIARRRNARLIREKFSQDRSWRYRYLSNKESIKQVFYKYIDVEKYPQLRVSEVSPRQDLDLFALDGTFDWLSDIDPLSNRAVMKRPDYWTPFGRTISSDEWSKNLQRVRDQLEALGIEEPAGYASCFGSHDMIWRMKMDQGRGFRQSWTLFRFLDHILWVENGEDYSVHKSDGYLLDFDDEGPVGQSFAIYFDKSTRASAIVSVHGSLFQSNVWQNGDLQNGEQTPDEQSETQELPKPVIDPPRHVYLEAPWTFEEFTAWRYFSTMCYYVMYVIHKHRITPYVSDELLRVVVYLCTGKDQFEPAMRNPSIGRNSAQEVKKIRLMYGHLRWFQQD